MVREVKSIELQLQCQVEVVHVPGTSMIQQGTDGLSRGLWCTTLQQPAEQSSIVGEVFAPVPYTTALGFWAHQIIGLPSSTPVVYCHWSHALIAGRVFDRTTIWCPPPEAAYQIIFHLLQCWTERPLTTSAIIIIPRILQKRWSRLSRHVVEIGVFPQDEVPHQHSPLLSIPLVLLYIPPHVRTFPITRVDSPPITADSRWHQEQAGLLRGLPVSSLADFQHHSVPFS
jgi:hypothetical protein